MCCSTIEIGSAAASSYNLGLVLSLPRVRVQSPLREALQARHVGFVFYDEQCGASGASFIQLWLGCHEVGAIDAVALARNRLDRREGFGEHAPQ